MAQQRKLYNEEPPWARGKDVAVPGTSMHNYGLAADIGPPDQMDWVHAHAAQFGLYFPMSWEDWHIEPIGAGLGGFGPARVWLDANGGLPAPGGTPGTVTAVTTAPPPGAGTGLVATGPNRLHHPVELPVNSI